MKELLFEFTNFLEENKMIFKGQVDEIIGEKKKKEMEGIVYQLLKNREEMNRQLQARLFTGAKLIRKGGEAKNETT